MLPGLEIVTSGLLLLAADAVKCEMVQTPEVRVTPITRDIDYDFSMSKKQLTAMRGGQDINSPYKAGTDTTTGGLRHDQPQTSLSVQIGFQEFQPVNVICAWYSNVTYEIELKPKIYIAREYPDGKCKSEIIKHEQQHVIVDREVINEYVGKIGGAIKDIVDKTQAKGPFRKADMRKVQDLMIENIKVVVDRYNEDLHREIERQQKKVDTLEEYERVSKICNKEGH